MRGPKTNHGAAFRYGYSVLLDRVFKQDLGDCERCGGKMCLVACIEYPPTVHRIPSHLGLPTEPPKKTPARAPPQLSFTGWDHSPDDDADVADQLLN